MPLAPENVRAAATKSPATGEEAAALLKYAGATGKSVLPCGGGCYLDLGGPAPAVDLLLRTDQLTRTVFYEPQELVVKVEAGMTLAALQKLLGEQGQEMPWDDPWPERQTVGGIIAAGIAGPRRLGFGMPRDHVLGVTVATSEGTLIRPGGRVVKNVAGYDLTRLLVGSRGALGVLTEIALKVKPIPESAWTATATYGSPAEIGAAVDAVLDAPAAPILAEVQGRWGAYALTVGCEGAKAQVDAEREVLLRVLAGATSTVERRGPEIRTFLAATGGALWGAAGSIFRINVPRRGLAAVLQAVEGPVFANAGSGAVRVAPGRALTAGEARDYLARVHRIAAALQGWAVQERGPLAAGESAPGLGDRARELGEGVRRVFDPAGVLSPAWR